MVAVPLQKGGDVVIQFRQVAVGEDAEARGWIPGDHFGNGQSLTMQAQHRLLQRDRTCNFVSHTERGS